MKFSEKRPSPDLPNLKRIGDSAFRNCQGLEDIVVPESVTVIRGNYTFGWCSNLKSIILPPDVEEIGAWAFDWCKNLSEVTYATDQPKEFSATLFNDCPGNWSGEEGQSFRIEAHVLPEYATDKSLRWDSSDATVAIVDSEGLVCVLEEGSCVIRAYATDDSGAYGECIVTGLAGIDEVFSEDDRFDVYGLNGILVNSFRGARC